MRTLAGWPLARTALAVIAALGLAVDTYVHLDLAGTYDVIRTSTLSQGDLFRVEATVAGLAALAVLVRPRRYTAALSLLVSAAGLAAVLVYRYHDVGRLGPIPSMYEPAWYPEKTRSAWAEGIAALASLALLVALHARRPREAATTPVVADR